MIDWREAHRWLRGYSDAKLCKPKLVETKLVETNEVYLRGYLVGRLLRFGR